MNTVTRIEPNGYDPATVPAAGDDRSRYELRVLPAGWQSESPAATVAHVAAGMIEDRLREAEEITPEAVSVRLFFVGRQSDNEWALLPRGAVSGYPAKAPTRPGRFVRLKIAEGALLDSFFRGEKAWTDARDDALWQALLEFAARTAPSPKVARTLNDALARGLALRAGLVVRPDVLPAIGAPH